MSFPSSFIEELRSRLAVSDIVGKRVPLTRAGREFKACCPFHSEKSPSFYINDDKNFYHCFGCGAHGDIVGFVMRFENMSFIEAVEQLASLAGLQVPQSSPEEKQRHQKEKSLHELMEAAAKWFEQQLRLSTGRQGLSYLTGRGLTDEAISRFRLGYAPMDGKALPKKLLADGFKEEDIIAVGLARKSEERPDIYSFFRHRVIFPVGDNRGRIVAFGARLLEGEGPKYLNSPESPLFHKGRTLYGLSRARGAAAQGQPIIVAEGYMDVIALVEAGFTGAVAPLGTALTENQVMELWKGGSTITPVLCFDGDNAGQKAAARAIDRIMPHLLPGKSVRIAIMPAGEDPDSLIRASGPTAMKSVIDQAQSLVDALWQIETSSRHLQTPEERAALQAALHAKTSAIKDPTVKSYYEQEIKDRLANAFRRTFTPNQHSGSSGKKSFYSNGQRGSFQKEIQPQLTIRKSPNQATALRERILMAAMVNHPELLEEFSEELSNIRLSSAGMDRLRSEALNWLEEQSDSNLCLDSQALQRHLSTVGQGEALAELLINTIYVLASFARPDSSLEDARRGWQDIWDQYRREQIHAELRQAGRTLARDQKEENLARVDALREASIALGTKTDDDSDNQTK